MPFARTVISRSQLRRPIRYTIFLGCFYAYVLVGLSPLLLMHNQNPVFRWRWHEFRDRVLAWPGGLIEYVSAGLSQFYLQPVVGALVLTLTVGLICLLTEQLIHRVAASRGEAPGDRVLGFLPAICLLVMLNRYTLPLSVPVTLATTLLFANLYAWLPMRYTIIRTAFAILLCGLLYAIGGSTSVLLACLCGLFEILARRSWATGMLILIAGAAIPYGADVYIYWIGRLNAYLRLTAIEYDFSPPIASAVLYACVPLSLIWITLQPVLAHRYFQKQNSRPQSTKSTKAHLPQPLLVQGGEKAQGPLAYARGSDGCGETSRSWVLRTLALIAITALVTLLTFDGTRRAALAVDHHRQNGNWDAVLEAARPLAWRGVVPGKRTDERLAQTCSWFRFPVNATAASPVLPNYIAAVHNINFALAQRQQLLDEMFRYPQVMGLPTVRLLPDSSGAYVAHSYNTDVLLELGDVNDAERVTCECLSNIGPRPWLLERLVLINVLKQRPETGRTCLNILMENPWHRSRAESLRRELDANPTLMQRKDILRIAARKYKSDRIISVGVPTPDEELLRYLLGANPNNRMAFDYLLAHYLLTLRDDKILVNIPYLKQFGYTRIPRHCEEAILLYERLHGGKTDLGGLQIRNETRQRFDMFMRNVDELGGPGGPDNTVKRDALLSRHCDTYWFYALFGYSFYGRTTATSQPGGSS